MRQGSVSNFPDAEGGETVSQYPLPDEAGGGGGPGASPLTTKGDIWGYDTADDRVPVGTDGDVLTADSGDALGISWQTPTVPVFTGPTLGLVVAISRRNYW